MAEIFNFKEGDYIYCSRILGIHKVLRVFKNGNNIPPLLVTELLFNNKYEKVVGKTKDREYTVDATYCRPINLDAMLLYEQNKLERVKKMIKFLGYNDGS